MVLKVQEGATHEDGSTDKELGPNDLKVQNKLSVLRQNCHVREKTNLYYFCLTV